MSVAHRTGGGSSVMILDLDELEHTEHVHELEGGDHGEVPFSVILVHSRPGVGPKLHRHPCRLTAIHGAGRFSTEWLDGADPT